MRKALVLLVVVLAFTGETATATSQRDITLKRGDLVYANGVRIVCGYYVSELTCGESKNNSSAPYLEVIVTGTKIRVARQGSGPPKTLYSVKR